MKKTLKKKKSSKNKSKKNNLSITEKNYKKLVNMKLSGKKLSKYQERKLKKSLKQKYCKCIKTLRYSQKNPAAYGICKSSIYKKRGFNVPNIKCY
tara:strand:+ start:346 stop:630 length:285 start_codon:yes stop_codon:yes gene_type:complete